MTYSTWGVKISEYESFFYFSTNCSKLLQSFRFTTRKVIIKCFNLFDKLLNHSVILPQKIEKFIIRLPSVPCVVVIGTKLREK
jgi:hypothetical protein